MNIFYRFGRHRSYPEQRNGNGTFHVKLESKRNCDDAKAADAVACCLRLINGLPVPVEGAKKYSLNICKENQNEVFSSTAR